MKIIIAGDYCDRDRTLDIINKGSYGELFDNIKPIISNADVRIVNFEFPVEVRKGNPIPKCGPNLTGSKDSIEAIKYAGFNVCTLANNHILDQGEDCCLDTKKLIEDAGIHTVGAGANLEEANKILYVKNEEETLAIINCCEREFTTATETRAGANPLNPIKQYNDIKKAREVADYVIVIVHGGHEHYQLPSPRMKETYRFFIDAGADAVVNHHQHCFNGYEVYKGKLIAYGLGNFLFDHPQNRNSIWNEGYLVSLDLSNNEYKYSIIPYIQSNEQETVMPMNEKQTTIFEKRINELNSIIQDDKLLKETHNRWMAKQQNWILSLFDPHKLFRGLCRLGIIKNPIRGERRLLLQNYLFCESYYDIVKYVLTKDNYEN